MSGRETLMCQARKVIWSAWQDSSEELASQAVATLMGLGMLVEEGGATRLARAESLLNAQPAQLTEEQTQALAAAGNRAVNDQIHDDLCACDPWPERCLSRGGYFAGYWDTSKIDMALPAVIGLWESMRSPETAAELARLRARVAELEAQGARVRTDELVPGDRVWHPYDIVRFTVDMPAETLSPGLQFHNRTTDQFESGMRVTGTDDRGDAVLVDAAPSYLWFRDDATSELEKLRARVAELEAAPLTVYRAAHDSIPMGLYRTAEAAREHCEDMVRCENPPGVDLVFDWIGDDDDPEEPRELVVQVDGREDVTGYYVTALTVAAEYDPDGPEDHGVEEDPPLVELTQAAAEALAERSTVRMRGLLAPAEDPHDSPLHHDYVIGRDLPEPGVTS